MPPKPKRIGILTAGGDSPGLNAAIRGVGKTAIGFYSMEIIGFRDGFRGIVEDSRLKLDKVLLAVSNPFAYGKVIQTKAHRYFDRRGRQSRPQRRHSLRW